MRIAFFLPMAKIPTATHQEQAVRVVKGRPQFYDPPEVKTAREKLTAHLAQHKPVRLMRGAVRLVVKWCFPRGKSHRDGEYRTSRPDTDNLQKLLKDCMTTVGFWKDDAQVASEICEKFWAEISGIYICAEEIDGGEKKIGSGEEEPERLCGTCGWRDKRFGVCMNADSHFSGEVTQRDNECPEWERREYNGE